MKVKKYWPQAHAIDGVTDAFLRTGNERYRSLFAKWFSGMPNPTLTPCVKVGLNIFLHSVPPRIHAFHA